MKHALTKIWVGWVQKWSKNSKKNGVGEPKMHKLGLLSLQKSALFLGFMHAILGLLLGVLEPPGCVCNARFLKIDF